MAYLSTSDVPAFTATTEDLPRGVSIPLPYVHSTRAILPGDRVPFLSSKPNVVAALRSASHSSSPCRLVVVFGKTRDFSEDAFRPVGVLIVVSSVSLQRNVNGTIAAVALALLPVKILSCSSSIAAVELWTEDHGPALPPDWQYARVPAWVWKCYGVRRMCERLNSFAADQGYFSRNLHHIESPLAWSWAVARNMLLPAYVQHQLLAERSLISRLDLLHYGAYSKYQIPDVVCSKCKASVANFSALEPRVMGESSALFMNPHGHTFRMMMVVTARVTLEPTFQVVVEDSWFEGYGWTVAQCPRCYRFIGWRFDWVGAERPSHVRFDASTGLFSCEVGAGVNSETVLLSTWASTACPPPHGLTTFFGLRHDSVMYDCYSTGASPFRPPNLPLERLERY